LSSFAASSPQYPREHSGQDRAVFVENGVVAVLEQRRLRQERLLATDPAAMDGATEQHNDDRLAPRQRGKSLALLPETGAERLFP
jgi:hypothetical protein